MNERRSDPDWLNTELALVRIAQAIRQLRRLRADVFGVAIEEPAWDMLLQVYIRDTNGASTTAAQLMEASLVPPSAAQRWLHYLEREGLVRGKAHPIDEATEFVELTDDARQGLERYLAVVRAAAVQEVSGGKSARAPE